MPDFEQTAPGTLRMERLLEAPIETVWQWLVDPALRSQWFAAGSAPTVDGGLELVFDHDNLSADAVPYPPEYAQWKGAVSRERVTKMEAPYVLAFTWDNGAQGTVTFELTAVGTRTRLVLTHTGITGPAETANFGGGWLSHLAVLQARFTGEAVRDFWELHRRSEAAVSARLGAKHGQG